MKWFKHYTISDTDERLIAIKKVWGVKGLAWWWLLMELVAKQMTVDNQNTEIWLNPSALAEFLETKRSKLLSFLDFLNHLNLIEFSLTKNDFSKLTKIKNANSFKINDVIPKMFEQVFEQNGQKVRTFLALCEEVLILNIPQMLILQDTYTTRKNKTIKYLTEKIAAKNQAAENDFLKLKKIKNANSFKINNVTPKMFEHLFEHTPQKTLQEEEKEKQKEEEKEKEKERNKEKEIEKEEEKFPKEKEEEDKIAASLSKNNNSNALKAPEICLVNPKPKQTYSDTFLAFWKLYPRKVGKGAALRAWNAAKKRENLTDDILYQLCEKALKWQILCEQWQREGLTYIPHPSTYLNQSRWEDEPDPVAFAESQKKEQALAIYEKWQKEGRNDEPTEI